MLYRANFFENLDKEEQLWISNQPDRGKSWYTRPHFRCLQIWSASERQSLPLTRWIHRHLNVPQWVQFLPRRELAQIRSEKKLQLSKRKCLQNILRDMKKNFPLEYSGDTVDKTSSSKLHHPRRDDRFWRKVPTKVPGRRHSAKVWRK